MQPRSRYHPTTIYPMLAIAKMRVKQSYHYDTSGNTHICLTILSVSFLVIGLGSFFKHRIVIDTLKFLPSRLGNRKLTMEYLTYPGKEDVWLPSLNVIA
jgi:hypothetical protein